MSEENVELVKRQIGDSDVAAKLRDDSQWAELLADIEPSFDDDFEFAVMVPGEPVRGRGFREFRARFLDWMEPWETYTPGIERIIDLEDRVVVLGTDRGRMKGVEQEVDGPKGLVLYFFDDGKVARIEYYFDRDAGLKAAGLDQRAGT
jgi:ketosteroid isomerase-like protein